MMKDNFSPQSRRAAPKLDRIEIEEFTKVLKEIVFSEREVESAKIELALKSDFNLFDAFRMFDFKGVGDVTAQDLSDGLARHLLFNDFTSDDIYLVFRRLDRESKGRLNFNDFSNAVLPFSREYAALVTDRPDYYSKRERDCTRFFNTDTRREF